MEYCDNCNECIHSEHTFNNFIISFMYHHFQNDKKLQKYLVKELEIRLDVIENYLEEFSSICCHTFCNNCFKFYNLEGRGDYQNTEGYFEIYKLALKNLLNFSCKKCEDLKIYESIKDEFKEFRQITKTKLELLKTNKNDCSDFIDAFIDKYLKDE